MFSGTMKSASGCVADPLGEEGLGLRIEDGIRNLEVRRLGVGKGVLRETMMAGGGAGKGFILEERYEAPALEKVLQVGPAAYFRSLKKD